MKPRAILIAGPTASGKSALALALAKRVNGAVVNADALQVYENWRILTARPSGAEIAEAPHFLYGHVKKDEEYSVGHWIKDVSQLIETETYIPIITGGTGLYFGALTNGLSPIPPVSAEVRAMGDQMRIERGAAGFREILVGSDPETLKTLDQQNPARLQRAWEVLESTGHGLAYWHARPARPLIALEETIAITLNWNADHLNSRIDRRFDIMMDTGALKECEAARLAGFNPDIPSSRAIGAREIIAALDGKITMQDAVIKSKILTHQFAKRQRTWFRSKMKNWQQIDMSATPDLDQLAGDIAARFT